MRPFSHDTPALLNSFTDLYVYTLQKWLTVYTNAINCVKYDSSCSIFNAHFFYCVLLMLLIVTCHNQNFLVLTIVVMSIQMQRYQSGCLSRGLKSVGDEWKITSKFFKKFFLLYLSVYVLFDFETSKKQQLPLALLLQIWGALTLSISALNIVKHCRLQLLPHPYDSVETALCPASTSTTTYPCVLKMNAKHFIAIILHLNIICD